MARYIDAELALKLKDEKTNLCYDLYDLEDFLEEVPTADVVEMKHGYFIRNERNIPKMREFHENGIATSMSEKSIFYTCSCCGSWASLSQKFCSECGVKMDGVNNSL